MHNRIQELRKSAGLSLEGLANRIGTTKATVQKLETGAMQLTTNWMTRIAQGLHCQPQALLVDAVNREVYIVGEVGAGEEVLLFDDAQAQDFETVECPPGCDPARIAALRVKGTSMMPAMQNGWIIYYDATKPNDISACIGKLSIVQTWDGKMLVKTVRGGSKADRYHLVSHNADIMMDVRLRWCSRVLFIKPV
jgi:phage repressor protein C with HTH and peptisase S24 domain